MNGLNIQPQCHLCSFLKYALNICDSSASLVLEVSGKYNLRGTAFGPAEVHMRQLVSMGGLDPVTGTDDATNGPRTVAWGVLGILDFKLRRSAYINKSDGVEPAFDFTDTK